MYWSFYDYMFLCMYSPVFNLINNVTGNIMIVCIIGMTLVVSVQVQSAYEAN